MIKKIKKVAKRLGAFSLISMMSLSPTIAFSAGLAKAKTTLESLKAELLSVMPVMAVIALIILGIAYATNFVEKGTFARWAIGIIIIGSAGQITSMLIK